MMIDTNLLFTIYVAEYLVVVGATNVASVAGLSIVRAVKVPTVVVLALRASLYD